MQETDSTWRGVWVGDFSKWKEIAVVEGGPSTSYVAPYLKDCFHFGNVITFDCVLIWKAG